MICGSTYVCFSSVWKCFRLWLPWSRWSQVKNGQGAIGVRQEMKWWYEMGKLRSGEFFVGMLIACDNFAFPWLRAGCKDSVQMPGPLRAEHLRRMLEEPWQWHGSRERLETEWKCLIVSIAFHPPWRRFFWKHLFNTLVWFCQLKKLIGTFRISTAKLFDMLSPILNLKKKMCFIKQWYLQRYKSCISSQEVIWCLKSSMIFSLWNPKIINIALVSINRIHASKMKINLKLNALCQETTCLITVIWNRAYSKHIACCFFLAVDIDECVGPGGTAVPMTPFALTWMVDMIADVSWKELHRGLHPTMEKLKHNGQIWVLENDRCSVCSCQVRINKTL